MVNWCCRPARAAILAILALMAASPAVADDEERSRLRYVPAITSPFFNESPYITTEIRPVYMLNVIPDDYLSAGTEGGLINIVAVQARWAVNDRLALIMTKNGYGNVSLNEAPQLAPGVFLEKVADGPMNVAIGAKYAVIAKPKRANYLTLGGRYEIPVGNIRQGNIGYQGGGSGFFDFFASYATLVGDKTGFQTSTGFDFALDGKDDTTLFHYSFHLDHEIVDRWFGVLEGNLVHTLWQGERTNSATLGTFEGEDMFNFGSTRSGTWASLGVGGRFVLNEHWLFGAAGELPVTGRKDITDFRFTLDAIYKF